MEEKRLFLQAIAGNALAYFGLAYFGIIGGILGLTVAIKATWRLWRYEDGRN